VPLGITNFLKLTKNAVAPEWISSQPDSEFSMLIGCYQDDPTKPSFTSTPSISRVDMDQRHYSRGECRNDCSGHAYFALQEGGKSCKCGDHYGPDQDARYTELPLDDCTHVFHHNSFHQDATGIPVMMCTATTPEYCLGAVDKNAVFRVEYPRVYCLKELPIQTPRTGEELEAEAESLGLLA